MPDTKPDTGTGGEPDGSARDWVRLDRHGPVAVLVLAAPFQEQVRVVRELRVVPEVDQEEAALLERLRLLVAGIAVDQDLAGLSVVYGGEPLLPHPDMARWIEARVRQMNRE